MFLLLGAVVNVAVAWGCAVTIDTSLATHRAGMVDGRDEDWDVIRYSRQGATLLWSQQGSPVSDDDHRRGPHPSQLLPSWCGFAQSTAEFASGERHYEIRYADGRGWPMLALWCKTRHDYEVWAWEEGYPSKRIEQPVAWGIQTQLPPWKISYYDSPRTLPLRPIFPGFAFNTIFYAAILWLLTLGPFTARRIIRRRRGLCLKCGYDLRHAEHEVCPECGVTTGLHRAWRH